MRTLYLLRHIADSVENADKRLACQIDENDNQIYVTSSSRPDVPEGIALLHWFYKFKVISFKLSEEEVRELVKDAISFADKCYV